MKKLCMYVCIAALLLPVFAGASKESASGSDPNKKYDKPELILRYSEPNAAKDERALAAVQFAEIVKEKTNGRIEIQVFPGAQLGDQRQIFQNVQLGAIDLCVNVPVQFVDMGVNVPYLKILGIPFLFKDQEHALKVMQGDIGKKMKDDINNSKSRILVLDFFVAGSRSFFTKKPVQNLNDFKGLKIRVQQDEVYMDMIRAFGANPTPTATSEIYSAIQTGVVDGAENPIKGYFNNKYYEVAKNYTFSNHMIEPSAMLISELTWKKLTPAEQKIFLEAAATVTADFQKITKEREGGYMEELKKSGVTFYSLSDYDKWVQAAQPLFEKYGRGNEEIIKKIQSMN